MKKNYTSPCIELEDFQITQQITACGAMRIPLTDSDCVLVSKEATEEMKRLAIAGFFIDGCTIMAQNMDSGDGTCINTNVNTAFTS